MLTRVDAGGRARLPRAEPADPGSFYALAPVAAALQADPDGRRARALLPDRAVLPGRGPPRRPPARVHADRHRDALPDRDDFLPIIERPRSPRSSAARRGHRAGPPVPAAHVGRGDPALRLGQARSPLRPRALRLLGAVPAAAFQVFAQAVAQGGAGAGAHESRAPPSRARTWTTSCERAKGAGAKGLVWVRVGEGTIRARPRATWRRRGSRCWPGRARRPGDLVLLVADRMPLAATVLGRLRVELAQRLGPDPQAGARAPVGRRLSRWSSGTRRSGAGTRCTIRSRRRAGCGRRGGAGGPRRGARAKAY